MAITSNEARAKLRQSTLFIHLEPEAQKQAVDQLLNGESWDEGSPAGQ